MSRYFFFSLIAAAVLLFTFSAFAANDHGDRVCVYKHDNFHGHEQCYRPGEQVSDLKHAEIESIRVYGRARARLFEDHDFRGHSMEFTGDIRDLKHVPVSGSKTWNHIGSLQVSSDYAYNTAPIYVPPYPEYPFGRLKPSAGIDQGVCVYERPNYEGRFQCWTPGTEISDVNFANWRGRISSVRVLGEGRAVAFSNRDFRGDRIYIDRDMPDLSIVPMRESGNWNHEIESIEVR